MIAEVAQAHDGSLGAAHAYIDAAAEAKADAIKFQTHIADAESTLDEPFRIKFSKQDETRYAYWKRMEFTPDQWAGLAEHATARGLIFLSSAFSVRAVEMLARINMVAWKVGSGEIGSNDLLGAMAKAGGPVLLSTGMSSYAEVEQVVASLRERGTSVALFQCTSQYPVALKDVGLNVLDEFRRRFNCPVGLSDHSGSVFPALAAMAHGANMIEAHIVFDRRMFGPDTAASLTPDEFLLLADARDAFHQMLSHPVDKDMLANSLRPTRQIFGKSVALVGNASVGTTLTRDMLTLKKPGSGIPAAAIDQLVGKRLKRAVDARNLLSWEDVDA
ncbi:N-acetylneuraminate synthase [Pseudorhodoplanes sinuspersici]|uniref:N-acetylneuraminate synthase n=1 Tax=Pseudorhodoplanes sinuspersici TaxID=1235591 RepID=A0A1W6ZUA8_9HYPH|nr:N-acetylneuraminate synthase [Pseudorhodoplanes sinuspersici]